MTAVDYSFARYTGVRLKAAGIVLVIRYLTGAGKAITPAELATLLSAGVVVCFAFEDAANDAAGGANAGTVHAMQANTALGALGLPASQPVYFAVDEDITPEAAVAYFQGINAVRPASANGVYGEGALCSLLLNDGLVSFTWQSESTSFDGNTHTLPTTNIQQKVSGAPLPTTDLDILLTPDVGQYPRPTVDPPPAPPPPVIPVTNYPEDNVTKIGPFTLPALDENGNGSVQVPGVPDVTNIVSVAWIVPDPNTLGAYDATPTWRIAPTGELLVIEGGQPAGQYGCVVWAAG